MAARDRIRLRGWLREGPPLGGPSYFRAARSVPGGGAIWPKVRVSAGTAPANSQGSQGFYCLPSASRTTSAARTEPESHASKAEDGYCPHCHLLIERRVGED